MEKLEHGNIVSKIAKIREAANLFVERELADRGLKGIVPAHGTVFAHLFRQKEPVTMTALVQKTGRAKSTVTGIVKTLERHGYLYRTASAEDARSVLVSLTDKGWAFKNDFMEISEGLLQTVFADMPVKDRQILVELLSRIENNLGI